MAKVLKCPKCKSTNIREDGRFDPDYQGDSFVQDCWGVCMDCKAELEWDAIWTQTAFDLIVAVSE